MIEWVYTRVREAGLDPKNIYIATDDGRGVVAFSRQLKDQTAYVVLNRSNRQQTVEIPVASGGEYINWLNPAQADIKSNGADRLIHLLIGYMRVRRRRQRARVAGEPLREVEILPRAILRS